MYGENLDSQNGVICENDGFSLGNPVLGWKPTLSADKIVFSCETEFTNN